MNTVIGDVHSVSDTIQVTSKFRKRELVLYIENVQHPEYSDYIILEAHQDNCTLLDSIELSSTVKVEFILKGRRWEKDGQVRIFNTIVIRSIEKMKSYNSEPAPVPVHSTPTPTTLPKPTQATMFNPDEQHNDDLPF